MTGALARSTLTNEDVPFSLTPVKKSNRTHVVQRPHNPAVRTSGQSIGAARSYYGKDNDNLCKTYPICRDHDDEPLC